MYQSSRRLSKKQLLIPLLLIIIGLGRELLFPQSSLFTGLAPLTSISVIICFFGGLGVLIALQFQEGEEYTEKTAENAARQTVQASSIGLLVAGLVTSFKSYLEMLDATSSMLKGSDDSNGHHDQALQMQKKCLDQAKNSANEILWFVQKGSIRKGVQRKINDVVEEALQLVELLLQDKGVEIIRDFQDNLDEMDINDISVMQSVINLIKASAQSAQKNSKIVVSTRFTKNEYCYEFCVSVQTLAYIDPRILKQPQLSQAAAQSNKELDLYTVGKLIENQGGRIEIDAHEEEGTQIALFYPMLS